MSNPSKQKGTRAESRVTKYLNANGLRAERRPLAGSRDHGDLRAFLIDGEEVTIEVKTGRQTQNYSRATMEEWRRQTMEESANSGCRGILVIVRYKRVLESAEVWLPNSQWNRECNGWTMMYLDEFVDSMWPR